MPYAAALSEHPVAADAVGEVLGALVEQHGVEPDLAVVFAGGSHTEFLGEIAAAVRRVLRPGTLLGAAAGGVVGERREVEDGPALSVWAGWFGPVRPVRIESHRDDPDEGTMRVTGLPGDLPADATLVLLADPATFPAAPVLDRLASVRPDVRVTGGLVSTGAATGLLLDDEVHDDGAVGVVLPADVACSTIVSQGCRPVGEPMVVTAAQGRYLLELAGRPALERLQELPAQLAPDDRARLAAGIQLGVVIDEQRTEFGPGDFLVRGVLGADRDRGVLAVGTHCPVGTTVQFHVRDAASADDDLRALLAPATGDAALVFTCNGRGVDLFGHEDHDATLVAEALGSRAVAGMACAGEFGPVGGRSFLHGFTASLLVFRDPVRHAGGRD